MADLVCDDLVHDGETSNGLQKFSVYNSNQGDVNAPAGFVTAWDLTGSGSSAGGGQTVGQELEAGDSTSTYISQLLDPGTYTVHVAIDSDSNISESDESNNTCEITATVPSIVITLVPATLVP